MSKLFINIPELLSFFDEDQSAKKHSNAIKTLAGEELMLALLVEYFRRSGVNANVLTRTCTTGKRKGPQLDAWVSVAHKDISDPVLYQTEIKSWSAHGVGGGSLYFKGGASREEMAAFKKKIWSKYWSEGKFLAYGLSKVLEPMRCPVATAIVHPLACLWAPVHPKGLEDPWFELETTPDQHFRKVFVFSASGFLRSIVHSDKRLVLDLPTTVLRMDALARLFSKSAALHLPNASSEVTGKSE